MKAFRGQLGEWLKDEFDDVMKLMQRSRNGAGASSQRDGEHAKGDQEKE